MPIAVNDNGDAVRFEGGAWVPTQSAVNEAGEVRYFDGEEWVTLAKQVDRPITRQDAVFPGTPSDIDVDAALAQTTQIDTSPEAIAQRADEANRNKRLMLEFAGGMASAVVPGIGLAARMGIAGAGQAAGSGVAEAIDPSADPLQSAAIAAATGATGEAGGTLLAKGLQKALAPAAGQVIRGGREAAEAVTAEGGVITPGQLVENKIVDLAENISEFAVLGGGRVAATRAKATKIAQDQALKFTNAFTRNAEGREVIGQAALDAVDDGAAAFRANARVLAKGLDDAYQGRSVDLRPLKETARRMLAQSEQGLRRGSAAIRSIAKDVLEKADGVTFEVAQTLRSDLLGVGRTGTEVIKGKAQGAARLMAKEADRAIVRAGADANSQEAAILFREFNQFWKGGKSTYNSQIIKNLARQEPDIIVDRIIRPRRPSIIRKAKNTINNPEVWNGIQGTFLTDIIAKNTDDAGVLSGAGVLKELDRFGDDALKEVFNTKNMATMRRFFNTLAITQKGTDAGIGRIAIQLAQGGAAVSLLVPGAPTGVAAAGILLGPVALSRLVTNPQAAKWLSIGMKAPPGSAVAARAAAQVTAIATRENLRD